MIRPSEGCDGDRLARARRGTERAEDLATFMEHLRVCEDCWSSWLVWRSLDSEGAAQPADEEMAIRAADRTLRALRRQAPRPRPTARAAAAVVLLLATAASAGVYQVHRWTSRGRDAARAGRMEIAAGRARPRGATPAPGVTVALASPSEPPSAPRPILRRVAPPRALSLGDRRAVEPAPFAAPAGAETAAALFGEATALRRAGRPAEAMAAFARLQAQFSGTPEATVSLISLAEMLADASKPAAALALFDAYLTAVPDGSLYPEALRGKARVLDLLGRGAEADAVRRELERRMPGSLYVRGR